MRKSPLSAPGGSNGRKNNYDWNSRDRNQQQQQQQGGYEDRSGSGYGQNFQRNNNKQLNFSPGNNQQPTSPQENCDDFIPLEYSSPVNNRPRFNSGNWRGHGNGHKHRGSPLSAGGGGGFNNSYRHNFYHDSSNSSFNDSNSPKFYKNHRFGPRRPHQKDSHRHINISNYFNVESVLEDPWAELMKNLNKRDMGNGNKIETSSCISASGSSCGSILMEDLTVKSNSSNLDSISQEAEILDNNQTSEATTTTTS